MTPKQVSVKVLTNALDVMATHLAGIAATRPEDMELDAIRYDYEDGYWELLAGRLGRMLANCHIVVEQSFKVLKRLVPLVVTERGGTGHNLERTYHAFERELQEDFQGILADAGVDLGDVRAQHQAAKKWLEWAQHWRSAGTYNPKDLTEEKARQYGRAAAGASEYAATIAGLLSVGKSCASIAEAVFAIVEQRLHGMEWPPEEASSWANRARLMSRGVSRVREVFAGDEWLYPGGEIPNGWSPTWPDSNGH